MVLLSKFNLRTSKTAKTATTAMVVTPMVDRVSTVKNSPATQSQHPIIKWSNRPVQKSTGIENAIESMVETMGGTERTKSDSEVNLK
jgi:hypothetical protein